MGAATANFYNRGKKEKNDYIKKKKKGAKKKLEYIPWVWAKIESEFEMSGGCGGGVQSEVSGEKRRKRVFAT